MARSATPHADGPSSPATTPTRPAAPADDLTAPPLPSTHSPDTATATPPPTPAPSTDGGAKHPHANIGIATGGATRLFVVDIDLPHGPRSLATLIPTADLTSVPIVRTGSGGQHLYFTVESQSCNRTTTSLLGPGIDTRGDGGYILAPPSRHITGRPYRWERPLQGQLPSLPDRLQRQLEPARRTERTVVRARDLRDDHSVIDVAIEEVRSAPQGRRNDTLNRAAYRLGRLTPTEAQDDLAPRLQDAAVQAGLSPQEARSTCNSGFSAGRRSAGQSLER